MPCSWNQEAARVEQKKLRAPFASPPFLPGSSRRAFSFLTYTAILFAQFKWSAINERSARTL